MQVRMMLWTKDTISHPKANTLPDYASTSCLALGKSGFQFPYLSRGGGRDELGAPFKWSHSLTEPHQYYHPCSFSQLLERFSLLSLDSPNIFLCCVTYSKRIGLENSSHLSKLWIFSPTKKSLV